MYSARAHGRGDTEMASFGRLISTVDPIFQSNIWYQTPSVGKANTNLLSYVNGLCLGAKDRDSGTMIIAFSSHSGLCTGMNVA